MTRLYITEIYKSIQGESSWAGLPCTFVRLSGCPLRCRWCDTSYSFKKEQQLSLGTILQKITELQTSCVEITGGEPLAQKETITLLEQLISSGHRVLLETGGSISIRNVPPQVNIIMDIKCPGSKMGHHNHWENINFLKPSDEIKFVIADYNDFVWAKEITKKHRLETRFKVLLSPAWGLLKPKQLVEWMITENLQCRLNLQLHKYIWDPRKKGV